MRSDHIVCTFALIGVAALGIGCVAHAQAGGYTEAEAPVVFTEPPTLVEVDADVWVVRDYDYPVYYVDGSYWVYRNDVWWRSHAYDKGWTRVETNVVPARVVHRDHHAYVHYQGPPGAKTRPGPRDQLASEPEHHRGPPDHAGGSPEHADEHHRGPPDHAGGSPEHAAEQHGGPPGHNEVPGVGNQRKAEEPNPGVGKPEEKKEDRGERKEEKKEEKKDHKDDKKDGPKKK